MKNKNVFLKNFTKSHEKTLEASLEVSYLIGKTLKPCTSGESLILPVAIKTTSIMHGEKLAIVYDQYHNQVMLIK